MFSSVLSLLSVSVAICVTFLSIYYIFLRESRNLPPYAKYNMFEVLSHLTGFHSPDFILHCVKDTGPVFRLSFLEITPFIMVCDPKLAREIYENEAEKPAVYKRGDGLTFGVSNILSKTTYGSDHHMVRKSLAPSFSLTNILSVLPKLHEKIVLLKKIFL
jgi:cytochrome P450